LSISCRRITNFKSGGITYSEFSMRVELSRIRSQGYGCGLDSTARLPPIGIPSPCAGARLVDERRPDRSVLARLTGPAARPIADGIRGPTGQWVIGRDKRADPGTALDVAGAYNVFWWEWGSSDGRTSLIYDPPDGRMPALTPEGQRGRSQRNESLRTDPPALWPRRPRFL
jgi:hypothetical protein